MTVVKSIGLPVMNREAGERRAFLPSLAAFLSKYDVDVYLENGYGEKLGFSKEDYLSENKRVVFTDSVEVYQQDMVLVLRAPSDVEIDHMKKSAGLISMLHYDSKPELTKRLIEQKINVFSLDSMVNDNGERVIVTYEGTAGAGVRVAFQEMAKRCHDFFNRNRSPYQVTIIGMGNLGIAAGRACFRYGDEKIASRFLNESIPGVVVVYVEKDTTHLTDNLRRIFANTDLLIDASKRRDFTKSIVANDLIGCLKEDAVILDLTADPYDVSCDPIQVKAIEGIPYGTLDKYVFEVDDDEYDMIPTGVKKDQRRVSISCNAWPGVFPEAVMKKYEDQLRPHLDVLLRKGFQLSLDSDNDYERTLVRASIPYFINNQQ
ncbi:hypothetical protein MFMK1_002469 [Metallumcola ferriviriculae]|uniref:Alanine dehydrogenase/pyridine nucleotide transhydrogenase N-terminal domain-containing protein n=1 Tax=Metallumcola ferriviriculae TaxID=3039180 RepID=A0AAU0UNE5_9FIRM|nr:hypothetical protein MFMK1_002469 [Desulfitibacteraceae bacterium MK1]